MSDHEESPDIVDNEDEEEQDEEEQVDLDEEVEPEEMVDDEVEDADDVEEDEKLEGQEGLDLEMPEEEGIGDQDEAYAEHENGVQKEQGKADGSDSVEAVHGEDNAPEQDDGHEQKGEKGSDKNAELLSHPPHGSEVFVGGISRDTTEEDLRELCASCGDIYEVRILKDKETNQNKGYAFVTYRTRESAEKAIETLGGSDLKGRKLRFSQSQQKKYRLFIGNIPKSWDKPELEKILIEQGPGVETVELVKDPNNPARNRGFAFVDYYNNACAENARKVMSRPSFRLANNVPTVSWADPRLDTPAAMAHVKVVYVRNLPDNVTEEQLKTLFERHGEVTRVVLPAPKPGQMKRDFGFVHFSERSSALKALEKTEVYELEGRVLETSLAKPPPERRNVDADTSYPLQGGIPPQHSRAGFNYGTNMYGVGGSGYGAARGYNQPVIYGRGPAPAGMTMVPMMLPDGRVGYVFQQPGGVGMPPLSRGGRLGQAATSYKRGGSGPGGSRRYRPY